MARDFFKLHLLVFVWGFTAVLGKVMDLHALPLVANRTGIAAFCLFLFLWGRVRVGARDGLMFVLTGMLIAAHWTLFFLAVQVANVSICMVGMATVSLWTAILEPLMVKERKFRGVDLCFGLVMIVGVAIIFWSEAEYGHGFLIALGSALFATVFSVINAFHVGKASHYVITFYGACLLLLLIFPFSGVGDFFPKGGWDWLWMLLLAVICTVWAYSQYVELLNRLSVYTINFANNLEPVYGIILAALILGEHAGLTGGFFAGAGVIVVSICVYPFVRRWVKEKA